MQYTLMYDKLHLSLAGSNGIAAHVYFRRSAYPLVWEWAILMVGSSTVTCVSPAIVGRIRGLSCHIFLSCTLPLQYVVPSCSALCHCGNGVSAAIWIVVVYQHCTRSVDNH